MKPESIVEGFFRSSETQPDKTAIIWKDEKITYASVSEYVRKAAAFLKQMGIKKGDRVAFYGDKNPLFAYTYLATHLLEAVAVPLDVKLPEDRLKELLIQTEPGIVLHPTKVDHPFQQLPFSEEVLLSSAPLGDFNLPAGGDLADLLFTTGTTGNAKGVKLTQQNILAGAVNSNEFIGNDASDIEIIPLPLHHAFGLRRLRTNLFLGATVILVDGFMFPKHFFDAIEVHAATGICMVPSGFSIVKKLMKDRYIPHFKKLKYIEFGSAPMSLDEKQELAVELPKTRICMHFGLTEVAANILIEFHEVGEKLHALGKPSPNVSVNILGDDGEEKTVGEIGEIVVKGDIQTPGYWKKPELTQKSFINGWFRTGDLGYKDTEGYVYLSGRKDDVINVGGKKVFPAEIEEVLNQHSAVKDSAVISVHEGGKITGKSIKAFVVVKGKEQPLPKDLITFLRGKLEPFKIPGEFKFISKIPATASGKKQRDKLK
jgi:long-chain acyl-CoA synthetase